jgi:hypothetical protein
MRLKIGDRVRIFSKEEIIKRLRETGLGGLNFNPDMYKFCGRESVITFIRARRGDTNDLIYNLEDFFDSDGDPWFWNEHMFEVVSSIDKKLQTIFDQSEEFDESLV